MAERKDSVSQAEKNLLATLHQIEGMGITTFKPFNLHRIRTTLGEIYDTAFQALPRIVASDINPAELALIDITSRPSSSGESGVYPNDPFSKVIENLRREGKVRISKRAPLNSRLDLSYDEIRQHVLPSIGDLLGVDRSGIRIPKFTEYFLSMLAYPRLNQRSDVWEWLEDESEGWWRFSGSHLTALFSEGIVAVPYLRSPSRRNHNLGFRPIIVFQ